MAKKRIGILTGGGDVPGTELRHQIGGLPRRGNRMRSRSVSAGAGKD